MFESFAKAMLYLALGQSPGVQPASDVLFSNSRAQRMEANFPESRRAEIRELLLYSSQDQGETWSQVSRITPEQREFSFTAPVDGQYWLRVAVVNRENRQEPANLYKVQPNWKLVIDTLKPLARIVSATRNGSEVAVTWEIQESHPDWSAFRLEYLNTPGGSATPINAAAGLTGSARFTPNTNGPVIVRLTMRDKAGNETLVTQDVAARDGVVANSAPTLAPQMPVLPNAPATIPPSAPQAQIPAAPPADFSSALAQAPLPVAPQVAPQVAPHAPAETFTPRPHDGGAAIPGNPESGSYRPSNHYRTLTQNPPVSQPAPLAPLDRGGRWASNAAPAVPPTPPELPIASSKDQVVQAQYQAPSPPPSNTPRRPLPPLEYINNAEAVLKYQLSKIGPSGVGSVDIYLTQDDGQTWEHVATDPAVVGKTTGGEHQGIVELPGDGVYGFSLVVKSQAQLKQEMASADKKGRGPRSGDVPEIRVEVDTVPPTAELFPPRRDPAKANSLLLIWTANDKNLGSNPITLEWAERRDGPWFPIAANIANSGKHSWQLPDRLPVQVYMRLRAKDLAGNEGVAVTPDPQLVDLSEPEGHLVNVTVPPRR